MRNERYKLDVIKSRIAILTVLCVLGYMSNQIRGQEVRQSPDGRALELDSPLEREMKSGEEHNYRASAEVGQFVHVLIDQMGLDVVVGMWSPDRKKLMEVDSPNGKEGPEPVKLIAHSGGNYVLQVRPLERGVSGR